MTADEAIADIENAVRALAGEDRNDTRTAPAPPVTATPLHAGRKHGTADALDGPPRLSNVGAGTCNEPRGEAA